MSAIVLVTTTSLTSDILRYLHSDISDKRMLLRTRVVGVMIRLIAAVSAIDIPQQIVASGIREHGRHPLRPGAAPSSASTGREARKPDLSPACWPLSFR
jgi:hypothetical protein